MNELGECVRRVLKETDAERSRFPANPTLAFISRNPNGQPSSYIRKADAQLGPNQALEIAITRDRERSTCCAMLDSEISE